MNLDRFKGICMNQYRDDRSYRGFLQSDDGVIARVIEANDTWITFEGTFGLSQNLIERLKHQPEHIVFSERSRIARLGVQITCQVPTPERLSSRTLTLTLTATSVIPGYPGLNELRMFFDVGLPVGRLVFCDPEALLSSDEVLKALERSELKLPASTAIGSDGSIVIAPHKVVCQLQGDIDRITFGRILLRDDGRELLNRYQVQTPVAAVTIPPGKGVITTCSMYLNDHYVVLQSGFALGRNLPATVLDPIKTRGIRIYLEIVNGSQHPIVNPLISARVYGTPRYRDKDRRKNPIAITHALPYEKMKTLEVRMKRLSRSTCHHLDKPVVVLDKHAPLDKAKIFTNGPEQPCQVPKAECVSARRAFTPNSKCAHVYATQHIQEALGNRPAAIALQYFPNIMEHRDIVNLACEGKIDTLYFFEPSCEHGPFLSQQDHHRLEEYHAFDLTVYWVCGLTGRLMVHTMRDGKGYFVVPERLANFHKSMLFAFYGSTLELSEAGIQRVGELMDALIAFWGRHIGIVTGGGSGVMELANTLARQRGILSGANFLDITDQAMTTNVDFCQVFQGTCRHSRQKWFEVTSFPIFNIGGLGTLEELGITLCNMKLSITERVPVVLFDTEGSHGYWQAMKHQIQNMVSARRAPGWIIDNIVITDDPQVVVDVYRQRLHLF
jgi:predicted Rossmann-fold nucleotide-binding protein